MKIDFLIKLMNGFINWRVESWRRFTQGKSTILERLLFGLMFMADIYFFALLSIARKKRWL